MQHTPGLHREADPGRVGGRPPIPNAALASMNVSDEENPFLSNDFDTFFDDVYTIVQPGISGALAHSKKTRQYQHWKFEVVPLLVVPFHALMQETLNLQRGVHVTIFSIMISDLYFAVLPATFCTR